MEEPAAEEEEEEEAAVEIKVRICTTRDRARAKPKDRGFPIPPAPKDVLANFVSSTHRLRRRPSTLASPRRTKLSIATPVTTSFTSACPLLPGVIDGTNQRLPQITPIACWFLSQNADKLLSSLRPLCSSFSTSQVQSAER